MKIIFFNLIKIIIFINFLLIYKFYFLFILCLLITITLNINNKIKDE